MKLTTLPPGTLEFDLETDGLLDEVTRVHVMVITDFHTRARFVFHEHDWLDGVRMLLNAPCIVGHNILKYDCRVVEKLMDRHEGPIQWPNRIDTILMTRLLWPELKINDVAHRRKNPAFPTKLIGSHSLKAWGIRLGILKGEYTGGWATWSQEMEDYCIQDVEVTHALMTRILQHQPSLASIDLETRFQECVVRLEEAGFGFDEAKAQELMLVLMKRRDELTATLTAFYPSLGEVVGKTPTYYTHPDFPGQQFPRKGDIKEHAKFVGVRCDTKLTCDGPVKRENIAFNPASRHHRARILVDQGWKPAAYSDDGIPEVDEDSIKGLTYPGIQEMVEYLIIEKRLGQVSEGKNAWLKLCKKGRIHGEIITNGCVTGRCSHVRPNLAQVPGVKDRVGNIQPYGRECRELFCVPEGYAQVGADASALELRCLGHYLAPFDGGMYGDLVVNGDVHTANQEAAGLPSRPMAKTFIYAYLYGAGDWKIGSIVRPGCCPCQERSCKECGITRREGKRLKTDFRAKFQAMAKLDLALDTACSRGYLIGIDGRKLTVRSRYAALNTLLQSAGGLVMKRAFVILNDTLDAQGWTWGVDKDWCSVGHIHDEFQSQVIERRADEFGQIAVQSIQSAGAHYRFRVPLAGEFRIGKNWAECH